MGLDLGKMVGPLPLGAWIAAVAGSLGLAVVLNRQDSGPVEVVDPTATIPSTATGPEAIYVVDRSTPGGVGPAPKGAFESNNEWRLYVSTALVGRGIATPGQIDAALRRYLRGDPAEAGDDAIINAALGIAFPPDPAPPRQAPEPTTTNPAPRPTPPTPPAVRTPTPTPPAPAPAPPPTPSPAPRPAPASRPYVIASGDTLSGIAARFYGDASVWPALYAANRYSLDIVAMMHGRAANPNEIWPGTNITLPGTLNGKAIR